MLSVIRKTVSGFEAGLMVSIGGVVFLSCDNRYVGAILFSMALLCICMKGYSIFTGKIGFIPEKHGKEEFSVLFLGLAGNFIGTLVCGLAFRYTFPAIGEAARVLCEGKLTQNVPQTLIRGIFCGVLMYMSVSIYRDKKSFLGIFFCIPTFILCGFEHTIADMFYFAASGIVSLEACGFLWIVMAGNVIGGMLMPLLSGIGDKENKKAPEEVK